MRYGPRQGAKLLVGVTYHAGSAALNTWHWAVFVGTTSTGHRVTSISTPEYYVPAV